LPASRTSAALSWPRWKKPIAARATPGMAQNPALVLHPLHDITRATPNNRLIPWLIEGFRRCATRKRYVDQSARHFIAEHERGNSSNAHACLVRKYRVVNHEPENPGALAQLGTTPDGTPALLNRQFLEPTFASSRLHRTAFLRRFQWRPKGIMPGVAGSRPS